MLNNVTFFNWCAFVFKFQVTIQHISKTSKKSDSFSFQKHKNVFVCFFLICKFFFLIKKNFINDNNTEW